MMVAAVRHVDMSNQSRKKGRLRMVTGSPEMTLVLCLMTFSLYDCSIMYKLNKCDCEYRFYFSSTPTLMYTYLWAILLLVLIRLYYVCVSVS